MVLSWGFQMVMLGYTVHLIFALVKHVHNPSLSSNLVFAHV